MQAATAVAAGPRPGAKGRGPRAKGQVETRGKGLGDNGQAPLLSSQNDDIVSLTLGQIRNSRAKTHSFAHYAFSRISLRRTAHCADTGYGAQRGQQGNYGCYRVESFSHFVTVSQSPQAALRAASSTFRTRGALSTGGFATAQAPLLPLTSASPPKGATRHVYKLTRWYKQTKPYTLYLLTPL